MANDYQPPCAEAPCQVLGQFDRVSDELTYIHRVGWLDAGTRLAGAALVPFDHDEIGFKEAVQTNRRHLGLAGAAMQLQQEWAIGAPTPYEKPLTYAAERQLLKCRNASRDRSSLRITNRLCPRRGAKLRQQGHKEES